MEIDFRRLIAPVFYKLHNDIKLHRYTHYWFPGGRGSSKSSFISLEIILRLMQDAGHHGIVFRKVGDTLRDSVFAQLLWAVEMLGAKDDWEVRVSPLQLKYRPNGNTILFRGVDDPMKTKSIKMAQGYFAYIWFEELAEFSSMEEISPILQSLLRGGEKFWVFYSYNPPQSANNWVNAEAVIERPGKVVKRSAYLDIPKEWLGEQFLIEAELMKRLKPEKYEWQYMGHPIGSGGEIFRNVEAMTMSDELIKSFDRVRAGLDWGWSIDPLAYVEFQFDRKKNEIYIYHEKYGLKISNNQIAEHILSRNLPCTVVCDSAEQRSIQALREKGVRAMACTKGRGSVERSMRFLTDDLNAIYIDPARCPNAYREFTRYELDKDRYGNFKSEYPDRDNHTIDAVRYGIDEQHITPRRGNIY